MSFLNVLSKQLIHSIVAVITDIYAIGVGACQTMFAMLLLLFFSNRNFLVFKQIFTFKLLNSVFYVKHGHIVSLKIR